jgi:acetolactate synthase I/II/III large subunit
MAKSDKNLNRRGLLKGAAAGIAAAASTPVAKAQEAPPPPPRGANPPTVAQRAAETGPPADLEITTTRRPGSDYMVDVIKSLGIEYFAANPASTLKGLHESLINYGGNSAPEFITCTHEEASVAFGNGYYKISGKPIVAGVHGTVGSQHASMAVYNAYCDQAPVIVLAGNIADASRRRGYVDWLHSASDVLAITREYTKWDDNPLSLAHFGESFIRAYKMAVTPPVMPVALTCDEGLQESPVPHDFDGRIPKLGELSIPVADPNLTTKLAKMLVAADSPVIVASRAARTPAGYAALVELAELIQAPVIDQHFRLNFPTRHPLNFSYRTRAIASADVILGLEVLDFFSALHTYAGGSPNPKAITKPNAKVVSIAAQELFTKAVYQNYQRLEDADMTIAADPEATLPFLIEAIKRELTDDRKRAIAARGATYAKAWPQVLEQMRTDASYGWDSSPISTGRLAMELWAQLKKEDWSFVSDTVFMQNWPLRLWEFTNHHQYIGGRGGEGLGYGAPAAAGAALANKKAGRISVAILGDGDFMYCPGGLWTAAHHRAPLLTIIQNNRGYNQEVMLVQRMAGEHGRPQDRCNIGTTLLDPNLEYAKIAQGMGVEAEGPVSDPAQLAAAIGRGIAVVKSGRPYLIDAVTQSR